jgi:MFS transporter, OFA family, oxalate/formate antiporter
MSRSHETQRWVTLVACLLASLCAGFGYTWSVLLKPIGQEFGWGASAVSLSFTVLIVFAASTSIFVGKALQYLQPRTCLLSGAAVFGAGIACIGFVNSLGMLYGLSMVAGVGLGIIYPGATMTNLIRYFPDKRGLASGLLAAGYGIGPVVWAPASVALIDQFGLMWAMRILGGLFFVVVAVCSRLVSTAPAGYAPAGWAPDVGKVAQMRTTVDKDWKRMLATPVFWVLAILFTIGTTSGLMVIGHASPIAQDVLGISPASAGRVVSFLAVGMVLGKIGWGALSDRVGRFPVFVMMLILAAVALLVMWGADTYAPLVLGICAVGLCYGGFLALMAPITAEAFGNKNLGINFGIMFLTVALAAYVGPRLAASVYEATGGDYGWAFIIAAIMSAAGLVLVGAYMVLARRRAPKATERHARLGGHVEEPKTSEA